MVVDCCSVWLLSDDRNIAREYNARARALTDSASLRQSFSFFFFWFAGVRRRRRHLKVGAEALATPEFVHSGFSNAP